MIEATTLSYFFFSFDCFLFFANLSIRCRSNGDVHNVVHILPKLSVDVLKVVPEGVELEISILISLAKDVFLEYPYKAK